MSDFETMRSMLDRAGVSYEVQERGFEDGEASQLEIRSTGNDSTDPAEDGRGKNRGYGGFFSVFSFTNDGSLRYVGIWE